MKIRVSDSHLTDDLKQVRYRPVEMIIKEERKKKAYRVVLS